MGRLLIDTNLCKGLYVILYIARRPTVVHYKRQKDFKTATQNENTDLFPALSPDFNNLL